MTGKLRVVRRAGAEDVTALVELRVLMFRAMGSPGVEDPGWQEAARQWFGQRLDVDDVRMVVVEVAGGVVATAMGTRRDAAPSPSSRAAGDVLISNVATFPDHRRQGHSRAAIEEVTVWAGSTGVGRVELVATGDGAPLYTSLGFAPSPWPLMRRPLSDR